MGYCIHQVDSFIKIKRDKFKEALAAIKALAGKETIEDSGGSHFSWVDDDFATKYDDLHDMMEEWRYELEYDDEGNVDGIQFTGEKIGDDLILFNAIAPFVEAGNYITMMGEDGAKWKWAFDGTTCKEQDSTVVFEDGEMSSIEKKRAIKLFNEFIDGAPEITVLSNDDGVMSAIPQTYMKQLFADFVEGK